LGAHFNPKTNNWKFDEFSSNDSEYIRRKAEEEKTSEGPPESKN